MTASTTPPASAASSPPSLPACTTPRRASPPPTVVIHGDADPIFARPHAQTVAANIPDAELEVVPGMGHEMPPPLWPRLHAAIERAAARAGVGAPGA